MRNNSKNRVSDSRPVFNHSYHILGLYIQDRLYAQERRYRNEQEMQECIRRIDDSYLGTLEKDGKLQMELNRNYRNILEDLKNDYPRFTRKRLLVFSLTAAGIPNELIRQRVQLPYKGSVYTMRCLMIQQIQAKNCPRRNEYLSMLGR
jgi:hypothetical protein